MSSATFTFTDGRVKGKMRSYCKNLPEPPSINFSFPTTRTNQFVHGLCVMGATFAEATSTNAGLKYTMVSERFDNGVRLWDDRNYVADGVSGIEMCQGGIYLKPNKHKVRQIIVILQFLT